MRCTVDPRFVTLLTRVLLPGNKMRWDNKIGAYKALRRPSVRTSARFEEDYTV